MQDSTSEEKVTLLISMGFAKSQARQALDLCQGNVDMAVDRIISGQIGVANASSSSSFTRGEVEEVEGQGVTIVQAANGVNQYSFSDGGPSACTCIALHVASSALDYLSHCHDRIDEKDDHRHCTVQNNSNEIATHNSTDKYPIPEARNFFTAERLQSMLCRGVEMYNVLIKGQGNMGTSLGNTTTAQNQHHQDHLSPEQVLALLDSSSTNTNTSAHAQWNVSLKLLKCGIRQGLLHSQYNMTPKPYHHTFQTATEHATDLKGILHDCHFVHQQEQEEEQVVNGNNYEEEWMCAIITKPPETVCVFLPPRKRVVVLQERLPYVLVDSHPRPGLGIESAYAKFHSSLESLVSTLTTDIFPFTHLGYDDEEQDWMTAMYNSFDVYPLRLRK